MFEKSYWELGFTNGTNTGSNLHNCPNEYRRATEDEIREVYKPKFKVGDTVRVERKVIPDGWYNSWTERMDQYQQVEGRVVVIKLKGSCYEYRMDFETGSSFPEESLVLVEKRSPQTR